MSSHQILMYLGIAAVLIVSVVCHEMAHGLAALALGDTTARDAGRLSFNPLRHVDPVGTVVVPLALTLVHLPAFGWARPVPINPAGMRNPRLGMMIVAVAGPLANVVLACLGAVAHGLLQRASVGMLDGYEDGYRLIEAVIEVNLVLAIFNLLPFPPFDGSHLVEGVLPRRAAWAYARLRRFAMPLMFVFLVVLPQLTKGPSPLAMWMEPLLSPLLNVMMLIADGVARL